MTDEVVSGDETEAAAPLDSAVEESQGGEEQTYEKNVPLDALQAERQHRQKLEEEIRLMKDHLSLLRSNESGEKQKPKDEFDDVSDDDLVTVKDLKRVLNQKEQQFQMSLEEMRISQKHPDYVEVVTKYLPDVLKNNPSLQKSLSQTQDYELAYYLAKNSDAYKSQHKKAKRNADAEKMVENASKSGSLSSVGSTSPINQARRWKDMSDAEFKAAVNRNMGYL